MIFLALLIAIWIWSYSSKVSLLQGDAWLLSFYNQLNKIFPAAIALTLSIILPVIAVALLMIAIRHQFFDLLTLIASVIFVLYGLGRGDMRPHWFAYLDDWQRGDYEAAYRQAAVMGMISEDDVIEDSFALHDRMRRFFCYSSLERCFAPVFWFVLLGPAAIVAYRLVVIVSQWRGDSAAHHLSVRWLEWLDYLPARLLALTFALAGNFSSAIAYIQDRLFNRDAPAIVVAGTAIASLELPVTIDAYASPVDFIGASTREIMEIKNLLRRSQFVWLIALGFMLLI